jgi:lipopolysaccharide/colanic/teichoic acid biosynthesis glycosyltransferase
MLWRDELSSRLDMESSALLAIEDKSKAYYVAKRMIDVVGSLFALIALSPFLVIVALLIVLDDPKGGPLFVQQRCGQDGKLFKLYKFRSMNVQAEKQREKLLHMNEMQFPVFKIREDPRITRVGSVLRKYCIDELPQFFNVLIGDMSIVGPRPPLVEEVEHYTDYQMHRLMAKPGITCIWQSSPRRNELSFDEWVDMDIQYLQERSLLLDFKLMLKTVKVVFGGEGE